MNMRSTLCRLPRRVAAQLLAFFLCGGIATSVAALDLARYLPNTVGNQWSYANSSQATLVNTVGSAVALPSGAAIPWTRVDSSQPGYSVTYNTVDTNGWKQPQWYSSNVFVSGYGYTSTTDVFTPAVVIAPANVSVGSVYTSTGSVTGTFTNVTTATLDYTSTTAIAGIETVWNSAGTQSWSALKVVNSITASGTVFGSPYTTTTTQTYWMVDGLGIVQATLPNASGTPVVWTLTSSNIPTVPGAPFMIGGGAGSGIAAFSFNAPSSIGGSAITGYTVACSPGNITASGTTSPISVSGLANGTTYSCSVAASNSAGTGAASAAVTVTPFVPPQGGWWWNPSEGGRGYSMEVHPTNGKIFLAAYMYDASGNPVWYAATLTPSGTTEAYSGPLIYYQGGQTMTGGYRAPTLSTTVATATLTTTSATSASLSFVGTYVPQTTVAIQRFPIVTNGLTQPPTSAQPQTGWYWNPAEGGRGYFIEVQGNTAFLACYMYDGTGTPTWYYTQSALASDTLVLANLSQVGGGQMLGGSYKAPSTSASVGSLTLQMSSTTTGQLTLPGGAIVPLQRFSSF